MKIILLLKSNQNCNIHLECTHSYEHLRCMQKGGNMNYCIHLKKRKNKPYCNMIKKEITLSQCRECVNKEYKKSTLEWKSPVKSGTTRNKSNKRITVSKEIYNTVIERDNYSCRLCGSTNWIQLHHILYRSQRKDLINNIDNCIMLCDDCHKLVHSSKKKWQPILLEMNKKMPIN